LVAHVIQGSPAYEAGVRDGDVLLRIGDLDVTKWRTDPRVLPLSRFWSGPAGTILHLGLKRNGQGLDVEVALQNIFPD
jgi:C-terminal processing protease CtpA/Prc